VLGVNYYHGEFVGGTAPADPPLPGDAPTDRVVGSPWPAGDGIHWYERGLPRTAMHWEVQPAGLTVLLERVWDEYAKDAGTALFVTENGAAYDDERVVEGGEVRVHDADRVEFLRGHLAAILDAADAGVDVRGYFYWSLMDNFEWAWGYETPAHGDALGGATRRVDGAARAGVGRVREGCRHRAVRDGERRGLR